MVHHSITRGLQAMTKLVEDHALAVDILEAQRAALTGDADALRSHAQRMEAQSAPFFRSSCCKSMP